MGVKFICTQTVVPEHFLVGSTYVSTSEVFDGLIYTIVSDMEKMVTITLNDNRVYGAQANLTHAYAIFEKIED